MIDYTQISKKLLQLYNNVLINIDYIFEESLIRSLNKKNVVNNKLNKSEDKTNSSNLNLFNENNIIKKKCCY